MGVIHDDPWGYESHLANEKMVLKNRESLEKNRKKVMKRYMRMQKYKESKQKNAQ